MIRVLIVDDHSFFRSCLAELVDLTEDLQVVGECGDGDQVPRAVAATSPDIVLMDVRMSPVSGLEATRVLRDQHSPARVIMLTTDPARAP